MDSGTTEQGGFASINTMHMQAQKVLPEPTRRSACPWTVTVSDVTHVNSPFMTWSSTDSSGMSSHLPNSASQIQRLQIQRSTVSCIKDVDQEFQAMQLDRIAAVLAVELHCHSRRCDSSINWAGLVAFCLLALDDRALRTKASMNIQ